MNQNLDCSIRTAIIVSELQVTGGQPREAVAEVLVLPHGGEVEEFSGVEAELRQAGVHVQKPGDGRRASVHGLLIAHLFKNVFKCIIILLAVRLVNCLLYKGKCFFFNYLTRFFSYPINIDSMCNDLPSHDAKEIHQVYSSYLKKVPHFFKNSRGNRFLFM